MGKIVQTELEDEEYRLLRETLEKKQLTLRKGLRLAISQFLKREVTLDPNDPFFTHKPSAKSGIKDLSKEHDKYLYTQKEEKE